MQDTQLKTCVTHDSICSSYRLYSLEELYTFIPLQLVLYVHNWRSLLTQPIHECGHFSIQQETIQYNPIFGQLYTKCTVQTMCYLHPIVDLDGISVHCPPLIHNASPARLCWSFSIVLLASWCKLHSRHGRDIPRCLERLWSQPCHCPGQPSNGWFTAPRSWIWLPWTSMDFPMFLAFVLEESVDMGRILLRTRQSKSPKISTHPVEMSGLLTGPW